MITINDPMALGNLENKANQIIEIIRGYLGVNPSVDGFEELAEQLTEKYSKYGVNKCDFVTYYDTEKECLLVQCDLKMWLAITKDMLQHYDVKALFLKYIHEDDAPEVYLFRKGGLNDTSREN